MFYGLLYIIPCVTNLISHHRHRFTNHTNASSGQQKHWWQYNMYCIAVQSNKIKLYRIIAGSLPLIHIPFRPSFALMPADVTESCKLLLITSFCAFHCYRCIFWNNTTSNNVVGVDCEMTPVCDSDCMWGLAAGFWNQDLCFSGEGSAEPPHFIPYWLSH